MSSDYEEISLADRPDPVAMDGTAFEPDPQKVESNYNYALIVVAIDEPRNWYNTSLIYNVLIQNYNYQEDNIYVLYRWDGNSQLGYDLDGQGDNDIDGPATWENIQTTITNLTTGLGHGDQLAVFFTGVPVNNSGEEPVMIFPVDQNLYISVQVSDISEPMEDIDCGQMIFTFDVNSSYDVSWYFEEANGTDVLCKNRYLHGPSGSGEYTHAEMYFSGGNYSEQLFYWASAARGFLPDVNAPWQTITPAIGYENGGGFPYGTFIPNHPGDNVLDDDSDSFIQMGEAFEYANNMNTWSDDGYCYIPHNPFVPPETPQQTDEIPFVEDLITLSGLSGFISAGQQLPTRSFIIADELVVDNGAELFFADNTEMYLSRIQKSGIDKALFNGSLGTVIHFSDNIKMLNGNENDRTSWFLFEGDELYVGDNLYCKNIDFGTSGYNDLVINNMSTRNCWIGFARHNIVLTGGHFRLTYLHGFCDDIVVDDCFFEESDGYFSVFNIGAHSKIVIKNSTIDLANSVWLGAICIRYFTDFLIFNNTITNSINQGISLMYCGWGKTKIIRNNSILTNQSNGVFMFDAAAVLDSNKINNNYGSGIYLRNYSETELVGNPQAQTVSETQQVIDNDGGYYGTQVYADHSSFPTFFHYNAIIDNTPENDFLVYCPSAPPPGTEYNVQKNYWGENITNPEEYLYPIGDYNWYPVFKLEYEDDGISDAEILYQTGRQQFTDENYTGAKTTFEQVVAQYPASRFASASLKELFALEQYASNNYNSLKQYYINNQLIQNDSILTELGNFLANKCDIKMEDYPTAITWFEERIQNPPSFADSIYSIIDLGSTYLLMEMENGGTKSSGYIGAMPEYKPENHFTHQKTTNYLLSLLPGPQNNMSEGLRKNLNSLKAGELLQNIPNPFSGTTQLWYKLYEEANVNIKVYDYTGKNITSINCGTKTEGSHFINFNSEGLPAGVYFYTLEINGNLSDSKKMTILK